MSGVISMTYCPPDDHVRVFEFTALTGGDILAGGDTELSCGDSFTMPDSATVCISVTDNDTFLSGDAYRNERGDDRSYQTADITSDGILLADDVKIYAEEYYVLSDQNGRCYYLIEIETAKANVSDQGDYFAFYGAVPPADAVLTVTGKCNVCGDWIDYRKLSAGLKWDLDEDCRVTIEAEDMELHGYKVDQLQAASGGELIRLKADTGQASLTFGADSGRYDLELAYVDENDGQGAIEVWVAGELVRTVELTADNNGNGTDGSTVSTLTIFGLDLQQGDQVVLRGIRDCWEYARIDALTFIANKPPVALDDFGSTDEDTPTVLDLLANDSDPNNDPISVVSAGGAAAGSTVTVTSAGGRTGTVTVTAAGLLTFDPAAGFEDLNVGDEDTVSLSYTITDGNGNTDTATATIVIDGVNDPPVAEDDFFEVPESGLSLLNILANDSDPDDDELVVTLISQPIEGTVNLDADGNAVFDPGTDFRGLSAGQTATVTFDYQISDGQFSDTATVTVRVLGEGVCEPGTVSANTTGTLGTTAITVGIEADEHTCDGTADYRFTVGLDLTQNERTNVVFVVDVSGSTGAADSFGTGMTVLEAEIEALKLLTDQVLTADVPEGTLTVTILPFDSRAAPTDTVGGTEALPISTFGDDENLSELDIDATLETLNSGGETNYIAAIFGAQGTLANLEAQYGQATNLVYFLSDGDPFPLAGQSPPVLSALSAGLKADAYVHGVALGDLVDLSFVDAIDNTGGAEHVFDLENLNLALSRSPITPEEVLSATLNVYGADGLLSDTFAFAQADFEETPFGLELSVESLGGLDPLVTDTNRAELVVELDANRDQVADQTMTVDVEIEGILPESFDFV